jgi:FOG: Ankyrin repeat
VNAVDRAAGATPLHNAAAWGRTEAMAALLAHGADASLKNNAGLTPLRTALENNQPEAAALLKSKR